MKRFFLILAVVLAAMAVMAACAAQPPEPTETPTEAPTSEPTPAPTPEPTEAPTPTPEPRLVSFTTGLPFEGEYKPVMVIIENSAAARPQTGLQTADVVYEVPVEGTTTRFVCVFADQIPEGVMPVRSARVPFLYIQHEWDAVFMHYGGSGSSGGSGASSVYKHELHNGIKVDIDGIKGTWSEFYRRVSGKSSPHNVMGDVQRAQSLYDYTPEPLPWLFDSSSVYAGETADKIALPMSSGKNDFVTYAYESGRDVYLRSMSGKAFKSAETGEQVSVRNVIVQYSTYTTAEGVKLWKMVGGGRADFYIGGQLVKGSWERASADEPTMFYDDKGGQIVLRPGNTWIHIHPEM
jgi:hypothetical protein